MAMKAVWIPSGGAEIFDRPAGPVGRLLGNAVRDPEDFDKYCQTLPY
jgi:hypothetical protein